MNVSKFTNDEFAAAFQQVSAETATNGNIEPHQIRIVMCRAYGGEAAEVEVEQLLASFPREVGAMGDIIWN